MITLSEKGGGNKRMHLHRRPFWWPCGGIEIIHVASPQRRMSRAISEATGRRHRATTRSVSLPRTPGQQSTTQRWINTSLRAVLTAVAMQQYNTAHFAHWWGSRASLETTGCHHRASTRSDSHQSDMPTPVFLMFFIVKLSRRPQNHKDSP